MHAGDEQFARWLRGAWLILGLQRWDGSDPIVAKGSAGANLSAFPKFAVSIRFAWDLCLLGPGPLTKGLLPLSRNFFHLLVPKRERPTHHLPIPPLSRAPPHFQSSVSDFRHFLGLNQSAATFFSPSTRSEGRPTRISVPGRHAADMAMSQSTDLALQPANGVAGDISRGRWMVR